MAAFGGFTAPLVCDRLGVDLLVLVAAMIPAPGEAPNDYWANTRYEDEVHERYDDEIALFYQDVPRELAAEALSRGKLMARETTGTPPRCRGQEWPVIRPFLVSATGRRSGWIKLMIRRSQVHVLGRPRRLPHRKRDRGGPIRAHLVTLDRQSVN
jgi:hypothetical protein